MIKVINAQEIELVKELQVTFCDYFKHKNELISSFESNPYVKICIYYEQQKIIGFMQYQYIYDRFELDNICVLEKYRKNGVASQLLDYLIEDANKKNVKNITLEVRKDNIVAINLYKKYGFVEKAIRKNYYDNCDGILMEKEMI